jgi:hypothetical protein
MDVKQNIPTRLQGLRFAFIQSIADFASAQFKNSSDLTNH